MLKKYKLPIITVFAVLFIDQCIKLYIKANYPIGEVHRFFDWCRITFTENPGMAWGLEFGGDYGKIALSLFRVAAVFAGAFYIKKIVNEGEHKGFIICVSLILAGALGNILDSAFYGLVFGPSSEYDVAAFMPAGGGYAGFLQCFISQFTKVISLLGFQFGEVSISNFLTPFLILQIWPFHLV
jgi:signal peptidase II